MCVPNSRCALHARIPPTCTHHNHTHTHTHIHYARARTMQVPAAVSHVMQNMLDVVEEYCGMLEKKEDITAPWTVYDEFFSRELDLEQFDSHDVLDVDVIPIASPCLNTSQLPQPTLQSLLHEHFHRKLSWCDQICIYLSYALFLDLFPKDVCHELEQRKFREVNTTKLSVPRYPLVLLDHSQAKGLWDIIHSVPKLHSSHMSASRSMFAVSANICFGDIITGWRDLSTGSVGVPYNHMPASVEVLYNLLDFAVHILKRPLHPLSIFCPLRHTEHELLQQAGIDLPTPIMKQLDGSRILLRDLMVQQTRTPSHSTHDSFELDTLISEDLCMNISLVDAYFKYTSSITRVVPSANKRRLIHKITSKGLSLFRNRWATQLHTAYSFRCKNQEVTPTQILELYATQTMYMLAGQILDWQAEMCVAPTRQRQAVLPSVADWKRTERDFTKLPHKVMGMDHITYAQTDLLVF